MLYYNIQIVSNSKMMEVAKNVHKYEYLDQNRVLPTVMVVKVSAAAAKGITEGRTA